MKRYLSHILFLFLAATLSGCVQTDTKKLGTYDRAMAMPTSGETRVFVANQVDWEKMPAAVPFVVTRAGSGDRLYTATLVENILDEQSPLRPDFILVGEPGSFQSGAISNHIGYGMFISTPIYGRFIDAWGYRLRPSRFPWHVDNDGTLLVIRDGSNLREAGMLEGDRILSVAGIAFPKKDDANPTSYLNAMLDLPVGASVEVVWIRAGTGRMSGIVKTVENPPIHLALPDATFERPLKKPEL